MLRAKSDIIASARTGCAETRRGAPINPRGGKGIFFSLCYHPNYSLKELINNCCLSPFAFHFSLQIVFQEKLSLPLPRKRTEAMKIGDKGKSS